MLMQYYESESLESLKKRGYPKGEAIKIVENDKSVRQCNRVQFFLDGFKTSLDTVQVKDFFELNSGYVSLDDALSTVKYNDGDGYTIELKKGTKKEFTNQVELFRLLFDLNKSVLKADRYFISSSVDSIKDLNSFVAVYEIKNKPTELISISINEGLIKIDDRRKNIDKDVVKDSFNDLSELKRYLD